MIGWLLSRAGLSTIAVVAVLLVFGGMFTAMKLARAGETRARADLALCSGRLAAQNAAVKAQSVRDAQSLARSDKAVQAVQPAVQRLSKARAKLQAVKTADASCPALLDELHAIRKGIE